MRGVGRCDERWKGNERKGGEKESRDREEWWCHTNRCDKNYLQCYVRMGWWYPSVRVPAPTRFRLGMALLGMKICTYSPGSGFWIMLKEYKWQSNDRQERKWCTIIDRPPPCNHLDIDALRLPTLLARHHPITRLIPRGSQPQRTDV